MKKVLILAYDFPPYVSVGGLRPYSWYKHFKEFGIYPIVVTRQWGNKYGNHLDYIAPGESNETILEETEYGTIIKTPYRPNLANRILLKYGDNKYELLRKMITAFYEIMQFLFFIGPKAGLYYGANEYLKNNKVDCIIATGEPFVLFKYASKLAKKHYIPWVADYRDPWTQSILRKGNIINNILNSYFEKSFVKNTKLIVSVSEFVNNQIASLIKNKNYYAIPNGYESELIEEIQVIPQDKSILSIAIVGTIYKWHPWKSVLRVLDEYIRNNANRCIEVNFYGVNIENEIKSFISNELSSLTGSVIFYQKISNKEYLSELAKNNTMLLFNQYAYMGTKIFDFISIKRVLLLCYEDDVEANQLKDLFFDVKEEKGENLQLQLELIRKTNSGIIVKDASHLFKVLENLHKEFLEKGFIDCNSTDIKEYSRKNQAKKLVNIISSIIND